MNFHLSERRSVCSCLVKHVLPMLLRHVIFFLFYHHPYGPWLQRCCYSSQLSQGRNGRKPRFMHGNGDHLDIVYLLWAKKKKKNPSQLGTTYCLVPDRVDSISQLNRTKTLCIVYIKSKSNCVPCILFAKSGNQCF